MGGPEVVQGRLFLCKFGSSKKIALFWPDFQRIEKISPTQITFIQPKFLQMRHFLFSFSAILIATMISSFSLLQDEIGKAGYYADSLHGRKTASGELYDKFEFTCAHKTLPFGTKVRVTRLDNNKSVVVRVNDRGPYVEGYVTDVSRAAAEAIGLIKVGVTRVKLEVLEAAATARVAAETDGSTKPLLARENLKSTSSAQKGSNTAEAKPAAKKGTALKETRLPTELYAVDMKSARKEGFGVQVGTLYDADNVLPMVKKIQQTWPGKALVSTERDEVANKSTYRVIIGPFTDNKTAAVQQKAAVKKGYKGCFVVDLGEM